MKISIQILAILFLLPIFCFSQNEKGNFFIETGVTMFGGGDYMPFVGKTGISYWQSKHFTERDGKVELFPPYNYQYNFFFNCTKNRILFG